MPAAIVKCENYLASTVIQNATSLEMTLIITSPFKVTYFSYEYIVHNLTELTDVEMDSLLTDNLKKLRLDHLNQ